MESKIAVIVLMNESSKGISSTSNVEQVIVRMKVGFVTNHGQFVVLRLSQYNAGLLTRGRSWVMPLVGATAY